MFYQVPNQHKIGLVYILEVKGGQDIHPLLSAVIVESAIKAIDKLSNVSYVCIIVWLVIVSIVWKTST